MKIALITGANRGIGREAALQLAAKGFHVVVGSRKVDAGREVASAITRKEQRASVLEIDVSDDAKVIGAAGEFAKHWDHLDVLVNNAAIKLSSDLSVLENSDAVMRETLETNTLGPLRVARAFAALLGKSDAPRVINVSSGGGQLADGAARWAPAYCISKTALNMAINSMCPGWVKTDMGGAEAPRTVQQGADTIVWLADEAPQKLTGKFLRDREIIPW
jgi:NAD(P)-dependent dehydrogenase (short-subunit alcohol dehydrogenase family)